MSGLTNTERATADIQNTRRAAIAAGAVFLVALALGTVFPYVAAAVGCLAFAAGAALVYGPAIRAVAHRSRALGAAPDLVCFVVLSLRLEPALERATRFAGDHATGRLADSLAAHAREARGHSGAGLDTFVSTWADGFPALRRAAALADAAVDAPEGDRERLLDRTLDVVVEGARERTSEYADAVHGPTMAVYAFGVVLPLALVGVAPAGASAGLPLTVGAFALAVGGYVLWLAVVLPALAVGLDRGLDRTLVGYHAGVALVAAATVYPVTATFASTLL